MTALLVVVTFLFLLMALACMDGDQVGMQACRTLKRATHRLLTRAARNFNRMLFQTIVEIGPE